MKGDLVMLHKFRWLFERSGPLDGDGAAAPWPYFGIPGGLALATVGIPIYYGPSPGWGATFGVVGFLIFLISGCGWDVCIEKYEDNSTSAAIDAQIEGINATIEEYNSGILVSDDDTDYRPIKPQRPSGWIWS